MYEWTEYCPGVYYLFMKNISPEPIARLVNEKIHAPAFWKNEMEESSRCFTYTYQNHWNAPLTSETIDEAKREFESILVEECLNNFRNIANRHKQLDDLQKYYESIIYEIQNYER